MVLVRLLILGLALLAVACDGKPCTKKPDYAEINKEVVDKLNEMLDDAEAYPNQREKVLAVNDALEKHRVPFRVGYETIRDQMIDQLVAVQPDPPAFHASIDAMKEIFMKYTYAVVDASLPAHRWFTTPQRVAMTKGWEEPPDEYSMPWSTKRAIDLAMVEIKATEEQKELVRGWRDKMEQRTKALYKDQHAVRMKIIAQWHAPEVDRKAVFAAFDEGAAQISSFMHEFGSAAMEVTAALTPEQRMWTNQQVNKLRRCADEK